MKKVILSLGLLAGISTAVHAQGITYGVKAGASLTSLTGDNITGIKSKIGFLGGGFVNFGLSDLISIQPEVLYSQKGCGYDANSNYKTKFNYIDVPVLVKVNAGGLFFEGGPQVGFLAAAKTTDGNTTVDVSDQLKGVDFGYVVGLGYQLESGPMLGLRYNGGISDLNKTTTANDKQRNSAFQLYVGYAFGGK